MTPLRQFVAARYQFVNEVGEVSSPVRQFVYRNEHEHELHRTSQRTHRVRQLVSSYTALHAPCIDSTTPRRAGVVTDIYPAQQRSTQQPDNRDSSPTSGDAFASKRLWMTRCGGGSHVCCSFRVFAGQSTSFSVTFERLLRKPLLSAQIHHEKIEKCFPAKPFAVTAMSPRSIAAAIGSELSRAATFVALRRAAPMLVTRNPGGHA